MLQLKIQTHCSSLGRALQERAVSDQCHASQSPLLVLSLWTAFPKKPDRKSQDSSGTHQHSASHVSSKLKFQV